MSKYLQVFKISFQQEFAYRLNFIMWRIRNVLQIFLIFFLWDTVFSSPETEIFGYNREKILTYVFGIVVMRALVFSSKTGEIGGEISRGDLTNYLLKPLNYFKYWLSRDLSNKFLNLIFAIGEIVILFLILTPPFFFQRDPIYIVLFLASTLVAILLYFVLMVLVNMFPLWYPEYSWGMSFLLFIFTDFLGGGIFPIDILPATVQKILYALPFPYLLFAPIQIYLGNMDAATAVRSLGVSFFWLVVLSYTLKNVWNLGLKVYRSEGR